MATEAQFPRQAFAVIPVSQVIARVVTKLSEILDEPKVGVLGRHGD
jgi:hypothetical protein